MSIMILLAMYRRFVQPVVRDLDTGQTFSLSEIDKKVPKGVDPAVLEKVKAATVGATKHVIYHAANHATVALV